MCHLTEDAPIGTGNAFDSQDGLVRVVFAIIGSFAREVDVLCRNLAFGSQFTDLFRRSHETTFAVGDSHGMDVTGLAAAEPRAHDGDDFRFDHARQMAANGVVRQSRAVSLQRLYMAIRQEAQFNQSLEAVADAESQAIALIEQRFQSFRQDGVAEQGGNELARAFRFVTGTETAGEHDDLCLGNAFGHFIDGFCQILRRVVAQYHDIRRSAGPFKGSSRIVFAVRTRADGDEDPRSTESFAAARTIRRE